MINASEGHSDVVNLTGGFDALRYFFEDPVPCFVCDTLGPEDTACEPGREDESTCDDLSSAIGLLGGDTLFHNVSAAIDGHLSDKPSLWTVEGQTYRIYWATYPSCSAAASLTTPKWYGFEASTSPDSCSLQLQELDEEDVVTSGFQTDHILEKQTLLHFFKWMYGDYTVVEWPSIYTMPTKDWILGTLLGITFEAIELLPFRWNDQDLWQHLGDEIGSWRQPDRMALVASRINSMKGQLFRSYSPATIPEPMDEDDGLNIEEIKIWQRNFAGMFQYMKHETVWGAFTATTQAFEDVFEDFDGSYGWNDEGMLGRPEREEGQPTAGLRDLWCLFIDSRLDIFSTQGSDWSASAKADLEDVELGEEDEEERERWLTRFDTGILEANQLSLPTTDQIIGDDNVVPNSKYSAWDNGPAGPWL
ncbi:hypothetical protein IWZ01DRAFT_542684 [Phyllosticta capitalensis]